jgi:HlyD family secretion protein
MVGDRVAKGQRIARLAQGDIEARQTTALATAQERDREYADLAATAARETKAEDASDAARTSGFAQAAAAADDRAAVLARNIKTTETLVKQGLATQPDLEQMRADLSAARQRAIDARNAGLALGADRLDRQARRARELLAAQYRVNDAHRDAAQLTENLTRESDVIAPIAGRVTEVKVSPGAFLAAGAPVAAVESDQKRLQAVVYLSPDEGKTVRPGMRARVEPATVRRDEYGAVIGRIVSVSVYPATPEGMAATLHNPELVTRFSHGGAPYAAVVQLEADPGSPSGYRWSSGRGPAQRITSGTLVHAEVVTRERRPLDLLLPLIRRVSGSDR